MFDQLDAISRKSWWNTVELTPRYLLGALFCVLMLGTMVGVQVATVAIKHRWSWLGLLLIMDWTVISWGCLRPVYRFIRDGREDRNG